MSIQIKSKFTRYELSIDELRVATSFSQLQREFIQNEIAIAAEAKLSLAFDPQNPLGFAQQEAELAGKIGILEYLLVQSSLYNPTQPNETE